MKRTNIVLDEGLIDRARKLTGIRTQREIVDHALRELVRRRELKRLLELEGAVEWEGDLAEMRAGRELCGS